MHGMCIIFFGFSLNHFVDNENVINWIVFAFANPAVVIILNVISTDPFLLLIYQSI